MPEPLYRLELTPARLVHEEVRQCELDVFGHWYGNTPEEFAEAYGPYEERTAFLSVTRDDGRVMGTCRVITPGPRGLKTLSDIGRQPWGVDADRCVRAAGIDPARTWDIATLAVRRELGAGGRLMVAAMYYGLIHATRVNDCPWLVAIIDRRARSLLALLGFPMHAIPCTDPQFYMGSTASAPVFCHVPTVVAAQRTTDPEAYRLISAGQGLLDVRLPDDDVLVLPWSGDGGDRDGGDRDGDSDPLVDLREAVEQIRPS
jgi:hypothetical protein